MASGKRDPALLPLSHDHHHALVIAMLMRRASDESAAGTAHAFRDFWHADCREHFEVEEAHLYPAFVAQFGEDHPALHRALAEHAEIRESVQRMEGSSEPDGAELNRIGELLAGHVRLEEREIFPMLEAELPADKLAELGELIGAARHPSGDRPAGRDDDA